MRRQAHYLLVRAAHASLALVTSPPLRDLATIIFATDCKIGGRSDYLRKYYKKYTNHAHKQKMQPSDGARSGAVDVGVYILVTKQNKIKSRVNAT